MPSIARQIADEILLGESTKLEVTEGPSREELFDALRLRRERRQVTFTFSYGGIPHPHNVIVVGIMSEDDEGDSWRIDGHSIGEGFPEGKIWAVRVYFNTRSRHGRLHFYGRD